MATLILNPKNGEKILDMCAAPGSKSTYIADLTCGEASILVNDIDMKRVNDLRDVVKQFGAENIRIALSDGKEVRTSGELRLSNFWLWEAACQDADLRLRLG